MSEFIVMTKPCKRGHMSFRYACSKACVECVRQSAKRQYADIKADPAKIEVHRKRRRDYYATYECAT